MGCGDLMAHFVQLWHRNTSMSVSEFYCNYMRKWSSAVATYYMHTVFFYYCLCLPASCFAFLVRKPPDEYDFLGAA